MTKRRGQEKIKLDKNYRYLFFDNIPGSFQCQKQGVDRAINTDGNAAAET